MTETGERFKILFLCAGNSARSIFGEYLIRRFGGDRFESYSAGAMPTGTVNPNAIRILKDLYKIDAGDARSKSWEEFKETQFDFVITVCDNAREACPVCPGQPVIAHWGIPDPAAATGSSEEILRAFRDAAMVLRRRIELLCSLPIEKLDRLARTQATQDIGRQ